MTRPAALLGALDGLTAEQINYRFNQIIAASEWGTIPALNDGAFAAIVAEMAGRPRLFTFVDLFCGAGGSSTGFVMAGGELWFAANHSKNNIAIHSANHPDAEHACADLDHYDMRRIPRRNGQSADVLWASPICTEVSPAGGNARPKPEGTGRRRGRKTVVAAGQEELELFGPVRQEDYVRTRATFHDVIRAAEVHRFKYVVVENVVEAAWTWALFGWWLDGMTLLNYGWQIVSVSAAHVGDALNPHAPQRRDRMYVVFHRLDMPKPDLELRPLSHCGTCGLVEGVKFWKKAGGTLTASKRYFRVGKYGIKNGQYVYVCTNIAAHAKERGKRPPLVIPLERPAASVIDWNDLGVPIGQREQHGLPPLVPNTIARVARGVRMFARPVGDGPATTREAWSPFLDATGGTWNTEPVGVDRAFRTRIANPKGFEALVCPPLVVNHAHDDDRIDPVDGRALPATTTKVGHGLVVPPFIIKNQSDGGRPQDRVEPIDQALGTVTTGRNQSLVVPDGAFVDTARAHTLPTSAHAALTAVHAGGNAHGLVVPYNRTGIARPADLYPMPTMHTVDGAGLATGFDSPDVMFDVMSANYRTLWWYEQARAQRFPASYKWVGSAGQRTAGAGNAVASNVACWLGQRVAAALNRTVAQ